MQIEKLVSLYLAFRCLQCRRERSVAVHARWSGLGQLRLFAGDRYRFQDSPRPSDPLALNALWHRWAGTIISMRIFNAALLPNPPARRDFLVRASGWTVGFGWCAALTSGESVATVTNENTRVASDRTRSVLAFRAVVEPNGSYLTVQVQIQPRLQNATLVAPDGRRIALMPLLRRLPAEQTQRPGQGDVYVMTDVVRGPAPGSWQLVLDHDKHATPHSILWQVV